MRIKRKSIFQLSLLILSLFSINCEITIYPDNFSKGDRVFNTSQVYDTTYERFYYSLGYYTEKEVKYYSQKYGIYYDNVKCNGGNYVEDDNSIFIQNVIKQKKSTLIKDDNYFEEIGLFKNIMEINNNIECPSNLKVIHDVNLKITYIIPVVANSSSTYFTIHVKEPSATSDYLICSLTLSEGLTIVQIDIKTEVGNTLNSDVIMTFNCKGEDVNRNIQLSGDIYLNFIFNKEINSAITLSNFRITAEDLSSRTGIKYNKLLDRSKNGLKVPDGCQSSSDCLKGHICKLGECIPCHYSCSECNTDYSDTTAISSCDECNSLTIDPVPRLGICPLNYVDLSQFKDITVSVNPNGNEFNERATIGLWLFFSDLENSRTTENDIYHIILENRMVISLVPGDNFFTSYCHTYEDLYRKVTSDTTLHSSYFDRSSEYVISDIIPTDEQLARMDVESMNGRWFHISCGISFNHESFYLKSMINGVMSHKEKTLKKEKLYLNTGLDESKILNDEYYNHIINEGEYLTLKIKNFGNSNAKIYGRHLMFFKEYIPIKMQYMYFNFTEKKDFPELLYQIPFNELIIDSSYKVKGYQYTEDFNFEEKLISLELSHSDISDFKPALNFYRLLLNEPNKKYIQIDLQKDSNNNTDENLASDKVNYKYLYDDDKILNCESDYYYISDESNADYEKCLSQCNEGYITYQGITKDTGYCDYKCSDMLKCDQSSISSFEQDDYDYTNDNFCKDYNIAYNLFYKCADTSKKYYLQFSGFYNSQTIQLNLENPLKSYIIEFWFYPDFFLRAKARESQFNYPTYTKNFFFHSNVIDCYFFQTDRLVPYIYDSYKVIKIQSLFNSNEWNKFVIYGKYYSETQDYIKTVYVNHDFDHPFNFDVSKQSKATILETIIFCENKCQDINGDNIHWTTGYYRDLRIWDGDMASYSQLVQYNDFYPIDKYSNRVYSILYYFPFSNQYITNNKIIDRDSSKDYEFSNESGKFFLKRYNYGTKFDIIGGNNEKGKFVQHASDPPFIDTCDIGCKRCWERTFCYECIDNYFLSGRKCLIISNCYFRSPRLSETSTTNVTLNYSNSIPSDSVTICFWTKPIGFRNQKQLMITLGSNPNLRLYYSSLEDDPVYGFSLLGNNVTELDSSENIIGYESEFRDNIGKWTFISIAYHNEIKSSDKIYFPKMIKFEINTDSIEANPEKIGVNDPLFDEITINEGYFGLFVGIKYYQHYIIQAITYEAKKQPNIISPFSIPQSRFPNSKTNIGLYCTSPCDDNSDCVPDEEPDIGLFLDTCSLYKDTLTTENSCMNSCSGEGWTRCNCWSRNHNSQMIFKNNNKNLCRPLEYINFSKMEDITIDVSSAKNEGKCTLQFWMYAYSYNEGIFQGITFEWTNHNKIEVLIDNDNNYIFKCYGNVDDPILSTPITINQWIFLSCAVDYKVNQKIYINYNTQDNEVFLHKETITSGITVDSSSLIISDKTTYEDWGVLFFRQIRLWKDAYFNAAFLSRILIETPSKFDKLLHCWEPSFKGNIGDNYVENQKVYDIVSSDYFTIVYNENYQSKYGMNVIDEDEYSILTMCSENGLYFDITLKKCLQFLDLSKMKDFSFKELPSAYSGSYAMAFWVFFEEANRYKDKGLHLNWSRHMQITLKKSEKLTGYCFPQGYYSDYEDNDSNFEDKYSSSLNKASIPLVEDGTSEDGVWIWVICSVSYYNRTFYIKGNNDTAEEIINPEILYTDDNGNVYQTSYPMRYYLSDLSNNVMYKSTLSIINIDEQRKLYFREILLFRNYIPNWYAERFKYMNLRMLTDNELPALLFVANFADFNLDTKQLKYIYFERQYGSTSYDRVDTSIYLSVRSVGSTFELSANFIFQPLCDLSTLDYKKYNTSTQTCENIENCVLKDIHATYCMEENMPLSCESGYLFTLNETANPPKISCTNQCLKEEFITPGTPKDRGICNTYCPDESKSDSGECPTTVKLMSCNNRIAYKCLDDSQNDISALFFSKCYNSPNFYRTISTTTLSQISSGYFYEFWFKIDLRLINNYCKEAGTAEKEYYLYSTPHSIYKDTTENSFYYQIINSAYKAKFTGINETSWNKIVIQTNIATTGQSVYVYTNFEKEVIEITSISSSITMRLQYISFCSRKTSGDCIPGSSNIMWGSAYYRNIRVWDLKSSSIQIIQDFNNLRFTDYPKSLILYYPLTIKTMDSNIIKEIISGIDNFNVTHKYSNNFQSEDNVINYNYETNLEWEFKHEVCKDYQILVKDDCLNITGYYLTLPYDTSISFDINKINTLTEEAYTFCIYMKFIGILRTSTSAQPVIFSFKDDTFIVYDISTSYLIFYIGGSDKEAFRDTNFHNYIGVWTPICIANLRSKNTYIHPNMITLNVNKIDIPFSSGFSIAKDGVKISRISLGTEIIAYFYDFRIYSHFIQGNFGTIISQESQGYDLLIHYNLKCNKSEICEVNANFTDPNTMKPCCIGDYNIYENNTLLCSETEYFDTELENDETCGQCNEYCKTLCYNSKIGECTCDMTETIYWLRKNKATLKTYCDHPPYIDYSLLEDVTIKVPPSSTNESTIEFWFFIYSYNTTNVNFKEVNLVWDKHNRVQIINEKNSLSAKCYALWDTNNSTKYTDLVQTISVTAFGWTSIRCGTNINKPTFKHFFNTYEKTINVKEEYLPYERCNNATYLLIYNMSSNPESYGFLFIRELKLWQQYNVNYIDTSYIILSSFELYNPSIGRNEGEYPGLITLIRSEFEISQYKDALEGIYHITNLVIQEDSEYPRESNLTRVKKYIGYNLVDPTNADYYKTLTLCEEGLVYNSLYNYCEEPSYTKCKYPGDTKDNCILCDEGNKFIDPLDGLCKSECPTGYYKREDMNQCRPCEETCYKCSWMFEFNCTECINERYLYINKTEQRCVLRCEDYNLTASRVKNNVCAYFDAEAIIVNYNLSEPIDINTFEMLVGEVINYTSLDYTVLWGFDKEKTKELNNNLSMTFPYNSPFIGDLTKEEEVLVDKTFFELAKKYCVTLTIIAHNILYDDAIVNETIPFILIMNSYPVNGTINIFPSTGLYKNTYFVIRCDNWKDDTSEEEKLQYRFYANEENTATVYLLRGWSYENEISTNFSVIYYQQNKSRINIMCDIKDELNATYRISSIITIAKSLTGGIYDLRDALSNFSLPSDNGISENEYNILLYHRSQYLLSLSIDAYKTVYPSFLQTQFESALDGTEVLMEDPSCVSDYCNGNGDCILVDEFIICHCYTGWTGKYCHIDTRGQQLLENYYNELFLLLRRNLEDTLSWYQFMTLYNLFKGASLFFDDKTFFSDKLVTFLDYAVKTFSDSIANNTQEYLEILDFYYSYEMMIMEKLKTNIQYDTNNFERNISFDSSQIEIFQTDFKTVNEQLFIFMRFLANQNSITRRTIIFSSENYYQAIIPVNPSFDDEKFFEDRKNIYKTYIDFMKCLNYIEMDKLANPYYQGYFLYIDYNYFYYGYNYSLQVNNSSPMVEMKFVDSTTGKYISITGCEGDNQIILHMPFYSYRYLEEFNYQKSFYDPNIYKGPDDPIFKDPVYIEESGEVSDDTIEQRIEKYSRRYNISPTYFDELYEDFSIEGITYINFTNDLNFIEFGSTHLCQFTNFLIPNNATYHPNGRFFYLARPRILKWLPNYYQYFGSLIFLGCFVFYLIYMIVCICYDKQYTSQEELLDYIKKEIVKNFFPYAKNKDIILEKLIPKDMNLDFKPIIKFGPNAISSQRQKILDTYQDEKTSEKDTKLVLKKNKKKKNSNGITNEEEKNSNGTPESTNRKLDKNKIKEKKKMNNFMSEKPLAKIKKEEDEDIKKTDNDHASEIERELGNVNRATFTINHLPKDFEKSKEEKERRIENYSNLKLNSRQFFNSNYKLRTTLINSFCNVSLFEPRWKKLTMLITEIGLMILAISIILTIDKNAKLSNGLIIMGYLFAYGLAASTFSNLIMYFIALFFHFPQDLARRLYKLVLFNGQLIVLKEWEEITHQQALKSIPGIIFCMIFWVISLYVGLGFTAVWNDQNMEFLISFGFAFILNFFVMELIVEGIIAIFYIGRKRFNCIKRFGYYLNNIRNFRCLSS